MNKDDPQTADDTASGASALCETPEALDRDEPAGSWYVANPGDPESYAVLREYFHDTAHFADLMNAFFFGGETKVLPGALSEMNDIATSAVWDELSIDGPPDVLRRWTVTGPDGKEHSWVFFLQNLMHLDWAMEVLTHFDREMIAALETDKLRAAYDKQRMPGPLYQSSIGKDDRLPGITGLVVYYGHEPWDVPMRRTELIDREMDAPEAENDRSINVFQAATQDLPFSDPDNKALFQAIRFRDTDMPAPEKTRQIEDMLRRAPRAARDTYLRVWGSDAMCGELVDRKGD